MKSKLTCPTFATVKTTLSVKDTYEPTAPVDVVRTKEYHPYALGWSGDRGREKYPRRGKSALHRAQRRGKLGMEQSVGSGPQKQVAFTHCKGDSEKAV